LMVYGRETLGFTELLAITTIDNLPSQKLLEKLGFAFDELKEMPDGEKLKVFRTEL
jgi:RimJ/RimL family protein N-acetyltransferase